MKEKLEREREREKQNDKWKEEKIRCMSSLPPTQPAWQSLEGGMNSTVQHKAGLTSCIFYWFVFEFQ
jgi:hypothetical protein